MTSSFTPPAPLQTAVLFVVFNRPDTTAQVFEAIRQAKPPRLYVAADGPREGREGEAERVARVREIATKVDWSCEVKTLFRRENLGCKVAVSEGITWFFEQEEQGIILEDDCLPSQSFFWFCEYILQYYKNDTRIWHVGGCNPLCANSEIVNSYYFSKYNRIWGWATWRRAWNSYDVNIKIWPYIKKLKILDLVLGINESKKYSIIFDDVYNGKIDTWDYQWFLIRLFEGLAVIPNVNLVSNIGFGADATHTHNAESIYSNLVRGEVRFPILNPRIIINDYKLDREWGKISSLSYSGKIKSMIKRFIK